MVIPFRSRVLLQSTQIKLSRQKLLEILEKHRNGTATAEEEQLLERWLDAVAQDAAAESPDPREKNNLRRQIWHNVHRSRPTGRLLRLRLAAAAAAVAALAAGIYFLWEPAGLSYIGMTAYRSGPREVKEVTLPDQSKVTLGPNTTLYFEDRQVKIKEGRAFFDVQPDAARPFTVSAGSVTTMVLGTTFTVETNGAGQRIILLTGKVKVNDRPALQPGQRLTFRPAHAPVLDTVQTTDALAWMHGEVLLRNASLYEVITMLEENYDLNVSTKLNTEEGNYTFRFPATMPLPEVLDVIQKISYKPKIRFLMKNNKLTIY